MHIEERKVTVREVTEGYFNDVEEGVVGYDRQLDIRAFDKRDARAAHERQKGICPICGEHFEYEEMHADHIVPWSKGGKTVPDNCQMLCRDCNLKKGVQ